MTPGRGSGLIGRAPYRSKRLVDLAVLGLAALPACIIGVVCAAAVKATSPGPILFRQERIGLDGQPFDVLKFRTMTDGDNPIIPDAAAITSAGAVLRRFSLDELPQLINVARGEMSIVGPRPTLAYQVDRYTDQERGRLAVRPGLTGWAQINGRNALSWADRIALDLVYVDRQSPLFDLRIIARTAQAILSGDGVDGHAHDDPLSTPEPNAVATPERQPGTVRADA